MKDQKMKKKLEKKLAKKRTIPKQFAGEQEVKDERQRSENQIRKITQNKKQKTSQ